jgi:hypothetical protein
MAAEQVAGVAPSKLVGQVNDFHLQSQSNPTPATMSKSVFLPLLHLCVPFAKVSEHWRLLFFWIQGCQSNGFVGICRLAGLFCAIH